MKKSNVIIVALFAFAFTAHAEFVSLTDAARAAETWFAPKAAPTVRRLRAAPVAAPLAEQLATTNGTVFYSVSFGAKGTLFLSSDTDIEPIIAFVKDPTARLEEGSPLWSLLNRDLPARAKAAAAGDDPAARARWARLLTGEMEADSGGAANAVASISDVRVEPFVKTKWNQGGAYSGYQTTDEVRCFDYYVPAPQVTYADATGGVIRAGAEPVPCGCVATAMAQAMRYWRYPEAEMPSFSGKCQQPKDGARFVFRDGGMEAYYTIENVTLKTVAGAYAWDLMPETPLQRWGAAWTGEPVTEEECQAIGKLTYDCGVAVNMKYNLSINGGSGATMTDAAAALKSTFGYQNVAYYGGAAALTGEDPTARANVILANLDAGCPVLLGITGVTGAHAIVADGYGFSGPESAAYVHLNMGWGGQNDVWYNLPEVNISDNPENFDGFDTIDSAVYNIFPTNSGEIVSGRVLDPSGQAASGAVVRVSRDGVVLGRTETSRYGIYAFIVPPGVSYTVRACDAAGTFVAERETDVIKAHGSSSVGNRWGNDLQLGWPSVRHNGEIYAFLDSALKAARRAETNDVTVVQTIELLRESVLLDDFTVNFNCRITAAADPFAAQVRRPDGAGLTVATNGTLFAAAPDRVRLTLTNAVFEPVGAPAVTVRDSGVLALAGLLGLEKIVTVDGESLELEAPIQAQAAIYVAAEQGSAVGAPFATLTAAAAMETSASKFVNAANDKLYGVVSGDTLVWRETPCDPAIAFARVETGAVTSHYLRLDYAVDHLNALTAVQPASVTLLRPTAELTRSCALTADLTLTSTGGCAVTVGPKAAFTLGAGQEVTVSNLTLKGYKGASLFTVNGEGASLRLARRAVLSGFQGTSLSASPAVTVKKGRVTLAEGAKIENCRTPGYGGGVYLSGAGCALDLAGGTITGCAADASYGGGVYAYRGSAVTLSGGCAVSGNTANGVTDNLYLQKDCTLTLTGPLTGSAAKRVGVRYTEATAEMKALNRVGGAFAAVGGAVAPAAAEAACARFVNDAAPALVAEVSGDGASLVWAEAPEDDGQVDPASATVLVVYGAGAETNHYDRLETAFARLTGEPADVVVLSDMAFGSDLTAAGELTLRAENGAKVTRAGDVSILIPAEAALTVMDIAFGSTVPADALFQVDGGALTFRAGAEVSDGVGGTTRSAAAVTAWNGGTFTMEEGAAIRRCVNTFTSENYAESGIGGAVHLSNATGIFTGGTIEGCGADRAGAIECSNSSRLLVSGALRIVGNTRLDGTTADNVVVQKSAQLVLAGELTGDAQIGITPGSFTDADRIGIVENCWSWEYGALTNSAVRFVNDLTGERGVVVTNAASPTALLVWRSALTDGVYTAVAADGTTTVYGALGDGSEVPVPPDGPADVYAQPDPIAFTAIDRLDDGAWRLTLATGVEWCVYTLYGAPALPPMWSAVTNVTLSAREIAADGSFSFTVDASTTNRFWRVTAEPGLIEE